MTANAVERDEISHRKFQRPEALEGPTPPLRAPEIPERDGHSRDPYERRRVPGWDPNSLWPVGQAIRVSTSRQHGEEIVVVDVAAAAQLGRVVNDAADPGTDQRPVCRAGPPEPSQRTPVASTARPQPSATGEGCPLQSPSSPSRPTCAPSRRLLLLLLQQQLDALSDE